MTLVIKSPVWEDLARISQRMAIDNPDAALRFLTGAERSFEFLKEFPRVGRIRTFSIAGIRTWRIQGFESYLIFYIPRSSEIQILAVLHGAMDLESALEERL